MSFVLDDETYRAVCASRVWHTRYPEARCLFYDLSNATMTPRELHTSLVQLIASCEKRLAAEEL